MDSTITYFEKQGEENTKEALEAAYQRLKQGDIKHVVVASSSGATALKLAEKLKDLDVEITMVAMQPYMFPKYNELIAQNKPKLKEAGVKLYQGTHALSGVERAFKDAGTPPALVMANTLRMFGAGMKVAIEVLLMAVDGAQIPSEEKVMALGGRAHGADTCIIARTADSSRFFEQFISEIVCKPLSD
jgi:uncharacterized protein